MYGRLGRCAVLVGAVGALLATLLAMSPASAEPDPVVSADTTGTTTAPAADEVPTTHTTIDTTTDTTSDTPSGIVPSSAPVAGEYIVTLADDVATSSVRATASDLVDEHDGDLLFTYKHALTGFAVSMSEADARALSQDPRVAAMEENGEVHATTTQPGATQGLDRIDQRDLPLNTSYTYRATGAGVDAYIIDTGIRFTHNEFGGRASLGVDEIVPSTGGVDCNGHGTHVAGTVGGTTFGVAKAVTLIAVRVLDCSGNGSNAGVIAGVDWVTAHNSGPSVANMSLGGGASAAVDTAVQNSIADGTTYAVAAGNDGGADACNGSPGRTPEALTVGSTTVADARSSFSNIGTCVDLFAPGSSITSAWGIGDDTTTNTISGTSMATPHVAGAAALFLEASPASTPAQVAARIIADSTPNKVTDPGTGSPNRLLYTGDISTGASVKIIQESDADSPQDFLFTGCQGGCGVPFGLDDDADPTLPKSVQGINLTPGTFTITQGAVAGWTLTSIVCTTGESVNLATRTVTITLSANEQTECTFTDKSPSITVIEDATPNSAQDFLFTGCSGGCGTPFPLDDDASSATPSSGTGSGLAPGTYTVTQAAVPNWSLTSLVCSGGTTVVNLAARSVAITVGATDHATCTWANSSASITLVQDTVPDNAQDFIFTGCGGSGCGAPFPFDDDAASATPRSGGSDGLALGTYTITQAAVAGWELFQISCNTGENVSLASRQVTIVLTANEQVTCTFSNRVPPPINDNFANAQVITGTSGTVTGTTVNATKETGEVGHGDPVNAGGHSIWFSWTAPSTGARTFTTCGSGFDTLLSAYTGTSVIALTFVAGNDDSCSFQSSITFTATAGTTYRIAVDGFDGASGTVVFNWS